MVAKFETFEENHSSPPLKSFPQLWEDNPSQDSSGIYTRTEHKPLSVVSVVYILDTRRLHLFE